jgi:tape measure domain-containing protein
MAETNQFNIEVGVDTKDSISKLKELGSTLEGVASSVKGSTSSMSSSFTAMTSKLGSSLKSVGTTMSVGLTAPLALLGTSLFKSAAQMEQISVSFEVFTGSAETAKNMLAQLKDQALKSPMQFQDITKGAQTLLGYGLTAEQVIPITRMLGDISGGNADKFARLSLAFGQVNASGRLMGQEVRQMINAGFNPLQAISEKTGESMASLSKRMKNGQISVQEVADAFKYATSEGGRFFGNADKQSQTLQGQLNKLQESVTFALAEIGTELANNGGIKKFFESLTETVTKIKNSFLALAPETQAFILKFGLIVAAVGPVLVIFGSLVSAIASIASAIGVLGVALSGMGAIFATILVGVGLVVAGLVAIGKELYNEVNAVRDFREEIAELNKEAKSSTVSSLTQQIADLNKEIEKQEKAKEMQFFNPEAIKKANEQIQLYRNQITNLQKISEKVNPTAGFDTKPPGLEGNANKSKRFKESFLDFSKEYDTYLKQFTEHRNKLIKQSEDSEREFDNIGLSGARKKLAILRDNFVKQKAEYVKFGVDVSTITKNYLLKTAQLQGEIDAEQIGALTGLMDKSISTNGLKELNENLQSEQLKLDGIFKNLSIEDKKNSLQEYGASIYSAQKDFAMSIANGFGEIAGAALSGNLSVSQAFDALGKMFLSTIGDLLIQMGTSAVKFGLFKEGLEKGLKATFGGGGALVAIGLGAIAAGYMLKGSASKSNTGSSNKNTEPNMKMPNVASRASGASYQYGGASYAAQTVRLSIDLTGAITATQTGYSINKSFETTLRVTGR